MIQSRRYKCCFVGLIVSFFSMVVFLELNEQDVWVNLLKHRIVPYNIFSYTHNVSIFRKSHDAPSFRIASKSQGAPNASISPLQPNFNITAYLGSTLPSTGTITHYHKPLLTLFTTFKNSSEKFYFYANTLRNWAVMVSRVNLVLFVYGTDPNMIKIAKSLGWRIHNTPRVNNYGTPYLKEMYKVVSETYNSSFYGYCNGDILFDNGLADTVEALSKFTESEQIPRLMVVGRRTNYEMKESEELYNVTDIQRAAKAKGKLFMPDAVEYFLIAHNDYPWHKVPDIVIGRSAYDNYLVAFAIMQGITVVDATSTILALHQTGEDGNFAGHHQPDSKHNRKVIGPFHFGKGTVSAAQMVTKRDNNEGIQLWSKGTKYHPKKRVVLEQHSDGNSTTDK